MLEIVLFSSGIGKAGFWIYKSKKYPQRLPYEYIGIATEIKLDPKAENEWIYQALDRLKADDRD